MEETDKKLLALYRRGEVGALEELVEKYRRPLFGFIINMTGGRQEADDIFQEVWLRVIKKIGTYTHKNFFGWLMRITHNIVIDRARRKKRDVSLDQERSHGRSLAHVIPGKDADPLDNLEASRLGRDIEKAVAGLPADQREVFVIRVKSDLPFREIAKIQKVSINTALARMQYALSKLKSVLQEDYEELNR